MPSVPDAPTYEALARQSMRGLAEPTDLDAMAVVFNLIRAANRAQQDLETTVHRPAGVTWAAFRVLFTIFAVGPLTPLQLARLSSVSAASVSSVLNTLERNGLVLRRPSQDDGRSLVVELTARGQEVVGVLALRNNEREVQWASALTAAERRTFARLLHKILAHRPPAPTSEPARLVDGGR